MAFLMETLYEEQLGDGRDWFFHTETPGFVDVSIYFALAWMRSFRDTRPIFDESQFPHTISVSAAERHAPRRLSLFLSMSLQVA